MDLVKGIIQKINVKEPKEGKYGKFAGYGVQVNGEWYNGLANEKNGEVWPVDNNGNKMKEGQEVELLLEEKNGYKSIVTKSSMILSGGSAAPQQPAHQPPQQAVTEHRTAFKPALWVNCLDSAINAAKVAGAEKVDSQQLIRVADVFFNEALKK